MPITTSGSGYNSTNTAPAFSISGYSGALPITIQNMPEEQTGAVYGSGDGSFALINYATERATGAVSGLNGLSSSIFITRNQTYVFAANQASHVLTVVNRVTGASYPLQPSRRLPRQRESRRLRGAGLRAELELRLLPAATDARADHLPTPAGPSTWPTAAVDCEPQNAPHGASSRRRARPDERNY